MAQCGCSRRCTCSVVAGPGVTVDGTGSSSNPYVISSPDSGSSAVTVVNGTCVGLIGDGTPGAPITPNLIIDPDPANTAVCGPGGLLVPPAGVECDDVRACLSAGPGIDYDATTGVITAEPTVVTAGTNVTVTGAGSSADPYVVSSAGGGAVTVVEAGDRVTVIGTGTPADPYVVAADPPSCEDVRPCLSAGPGATYDPATGVIGADPTLVTAGTNVTVTGTGTTADPYVVAADPVTCDDVRPCLSAGPGVTYDPATGVIGADPTTVTAGTNVTVTGSGTSADPYVVSAAGGGAPTVVEAGDRVTVTGAGTAADPYVVAADAPSCDEVRPCFSAGDGAAYDPATGMISARPSTDAGNSLAFGTDGGLLVPAAEATALQAADTTTVDTTITGTGTAADPYVVEADVIVAPEPNGLEATANGLLVAPSADAGNTLAFGADGRLFVPPDPPLETGCGLQGEGTAASPLAAFPIAGSQAWANVWTCDPTVHSTLKCDPTSGALWAPPEHSSAALAIQQNHPMGTPTIAPTTGYIVIDANAWAQAQYTADSLTVCRGVTYDVAFTAHVEVSYTANSVFDLGYAMQVNGGALALHAGHSWLQTTTPAGRERVTFAVSQAAMLPPHTSHAVRVYPAIRVTAGSVTIREWITDSNMILITR
ncbi:hypothetical protein [Streptomyces chilikensis]|uniref:Uncharacterized protein n=1 Tax=Streptomyces chilikensis TaxID=1194079 RepID=A0ABV3EJH6_9ACTN